MKLMTFLLFFSLSFSAWARLSEVIEIANSIDNPVVILDLDDTLFYSSSRTMTIFKELSEEPNFKQNYPLEIDTIRNIKFEEIEYSIRDTLVNAGIENSSLIDKAEDFWKQRFFTNEYVKDDMPIEGSIEYVNLLLENSIKVIYLTGRDDSMRSGTIDSLRKSGFPIDGTNAILITKKKFNTSDIVYKKKAFSEIDKMGNVIAFFENEPKNLNAMINYFSSDAISVFLDIKHSPTNITVNSKAFWITNYLNIKHKEKK